MADRFTNLDAAKKAMTLTPQEQFLYQHHLNNLFGGGAVFNDDGSLSTVYQANVGIGDRHYNIPTVWQGHILPIEQAINRVMKVGLDKYPSYGTPEEAEMRYQQMHAYMEKDLPY